MDRQFYELIAQQIKQKMRNHECEMQKLWSEKFAFENPLPRETPRQSKDEDGVR